VRAFGWPSSFSWISCCGTHCGDAGYRSRRSCRAGSELPGQSRDPVRCRRMADVETIARHAARCACLPRFRDIALRGASGRFGALPFALVGDDVARPLLHARRYADLAGAVPSPRTFGTGVLVSGNQPDLRTAADIEYSLERVGSIPEAVTLFERTRQDLDRRYERIVLVGTPATVTRLSASLQGTFREEAVRPGMLVLRCEKTHGRE